MYRRVGVGRHGAVASALPASVGTAAAGSGRVSQRSAYSFFK